MAWVNLVANAGGEYVVGGSVVGWRGVSGAVVVQSTAQALDGTASVRGTAAAAGALVGLPFVWHGNDHPTYWQAYVYQTAAPGGAATQVTIRDTAGGTIAGMANPSTSATNAWTRVSGTATPSAALTPGSAYMLAVRLGGAGTVYVDRAAVWQGAPGDPLAWAGQAPLFIVEIAPSAGASDLATLGGQYVIGGVSTNGIGYMERVGTPWTDVTWRVRQGAYRGGRAAETEQTSASECSVTLDNRDGALDPTTGTMGSVGMPLRVRYTDPSTGRVSYLFEGQAWSVRPSRPGPYDQTVELAATDRLKTMGMTTWRPSVTAEALGTQPAWQAVDTMYLDLQTWRSATGVWSLATETVITAGTAEALNAVGYLQTLAQGCGGRLVEHPLYGVAIEGRAMRYVPAGTAATFGTAAGEVPYRDVQPAADDAFLFNDWTVTGGTGGALTGRSTDATSGARYGYRSQSLDTRLAAAADVTDAAAYLAGRYAYPRTRIPSIEPNMVALGTAAPWRTVIEAYRDTVAIGTANAKVFVVKRPVLGASGGTATHEVWPEGVTVEWKPGDVTVSLDVSPGPEAAFWRMDTSTLGVSTVLAW